MGDGQRARATPASVRDTEPGVVVQVVQELGKGGLETMSVNLARGLQAAGVRPVMVALQKGGTLEDPLTASGIEYHVIGGNGYRTPRSHWQLARILRHARATAVHTHHFAALVGAVGAARVVGVPRVVHTEHAYQYLETAPRSRHALRWASTQCDAFVVVGESMREYYAGVIGVARTRLRVILNGVDTARYRPQPDVVRARAALGLPAGPLVGTVGRFADVKNLPMLLRAVAALRQTRPDVQLVMVGDGAGRGELEALAASLGYGDAVHFLGWRTDVAELVSCLDVYALTSWTEGLPLAVLEAMACGVPVVSTRVGDVPLIVRPGATGFLVPPGEVDALADVLGRLVDSAELRAAVGHAGYRYVVGQYSQDTMVRHYLAEYGLAPD